MIQMQVCQGTSTNVVRGRRLLMLSGDGYTNVVKERLLMLSGNGPDACTLVVSWDGNLPASIGVVRGWRRCLLMLSGYGSRETVPFRKIIYIHVHGIVLKGLSHEN